MIEKELTSLLAVLAPSTVQSTISSNADTAKQGESTKLFSSIDQDRIAEAGRIAIKHNLVSLCEGACNIIA